MNKSILLSIRPEWVEKILNGEKTIEVRKKFPKDYVGWVYIYCTKGKPYIYKEYTEKELLNEDIKWFNGKVVARFWCDKVEEIQYYKLGFYSKVNQHQAIWLKNTCLTYDELNNYLGNKTGYAIPISKLEIFDRPKELSEFGIKTSPQNYCFIERN